MSNVRNQLVDLFNPTRVLLPMETVIDWGCKYVGLTEAEVLEHTKQRHVLRRRNMVIVATLVLSDVSIAGIGRRFNRDHATFLYAARKELSRMRKDLSYKSRFEHCIQHIATNNHRTLFNSPPPALMTAEKIKFPNVAIPILEPERRECHSSSVAYARALYKAHGEFACWPELDHG